MGLKKPLVKKKLISLTKLKQQALVPFSQFIRNRDQLLDGTWNCISCGKNIDKVHASHFFERDLYPVLSFNENNVHASCIRCNLFMHGNLLEYRKRLILKIGLEAVEELEEIAFSDKSKIQYTREELIQIKQFYKNEIQKRNMEKKIWIRD